LLVKLRSLRTVGQLTRTWWTAPVDYDAQVGYFAKRSLTGGIQLLIGSCAALLAVIPMVIQFSPAGPDTTLSRVVSDVFAVSAVVWALVWWFGPWPSRRWSIAFIVYADVGITAVALQDSDHLAGLFGINALVLVSVYAMFFDGPRVLALHTGWALLSAAIFAVKIGTGPDGDVFLAIAKNLAAVASLVATPLAIHIGIWVLRNEANASVTDQLTGLLNRRGMYLQLGDLLGDSPPAGSSVMVMVIDLDRFKGVNDTFGHAVGDDVLVRSARRIKSAVRGTALVARLGGEEFAVVDIVAPDHVSHIADRVRTSIAAPADRAPVTASLGVTIVATDAFTSSPIDPANILDAAIDHADLAMFEAKRDGGNATSTYRHQRETDFDT
jgi:diguanylate cyclase (GGDEF)-like protein